MDEMKSTSPLFFIYDFFGYLLPGFFFLCILVFEYDFGRAITYYLDNKHSFNGIGAQVSFYKLPYLMDFLSWQRSGVDFKLVPFILLIVLCYLMGHVISALSNVILEKLVVSQMLGYPTYNLFRVSPPKPYRLFRRTLRWMASRYCDAFEYKFIDEFKKVIDKRFGYEVEKFDYYWMCFADLVRCMPTNYQHVQHVTSLYRFTRNTCFAFIFYVISRISLRFIYIFLGLEFNITVTSWLILVAYLFISLFLFIAYLGHYRRQTVEVTFAFYAYHTVAKLEAKSEPSQSAD